MRDRGFAGSVLLSSVFAPAVALVGFSSAYYHASFTFASMIADVQGMQLVAFFLLLFNLRDRFVSTIRLALAYAFLDFLALAVQIALPMSRRALFGATVVLVAWSESRAGGRDRGGSFFFRAALVTLALAFVIWLIDWSRLACSPEAWLQGHAVWHILGAVAAALIAEHCAHSDSAARRSVSRSDG
jgi:dihydroceramidase